MLACLANGEIFLIITRKQITPEFEPDKLQLSKTRFNTLSI